MSNQEVDLSVKATEMLKPKIFVVDALEKAAHRDTVHKRVKEVLAEGDDSSEIIHLGHCGWKAVGQVVSPTYFAMGLCRKFNLLPSERCTLLTLRDQYQAIQLCLARINKKKLGDFSALVSDVIDVWNELYREAVIVDKAAKLYLVDEESNDEFGLNLPSSRRKSHDPVVREMQEIIHDYREFIKSSGFIDHFFIFDALEKKMKEADDIKDHISSKVFILEGVDHMLAMEKELLKLLLSNNGVTKVSVAESSSMGKSLCDFDMSGIGEDPLNTSQASVTDPKDEQATVGDCTPSANPNNSSFSVETEILDSTLDEFIEELPKSPGLTDFSESELYVEHLILAHIRLLINTRDELALATLCSMPGREITQQGFHDIKEEAQKKNMPMYQTILSFIMRLRLGGKGYQADPDCPVLCHAKPLGEFVDSIMKLQNIVEEEPNPRKGAIRVLSLIKKALLRIRGRALKASCIEKVWEILYSAFCRLTQEPEEPDESKVLVDRPKIQQTTGALRPCLKLLIELCDEASSRGAEEVDTLGENFVTQCNSSKKTTTPVRIPTVLSLFSSPVQGSDSSNGENEDCNTSLRMRLLACKDQTPKAKKAPRFRSVCSWAPDDLSPVNKGNVNLDTSLSPIIGPTLKAVGGNKRKISQNWREIVEAVSQDEEERRKEAESLVLKEKPSKKIQQSKSEEKKSKRSLLTDISNITSSEDNTKKGKSSKIKKSPAKKKSKSLPIPKGQKPITSFFKV